eukprot:TRINITY_DN37558_c0_g1_i1.p1 TRINITY_DN37558_c0_g1~~TRINITY_DN37558_c0_g1_i1.p1  ORF type:complete len:212 (+),score=33.35 TRINITY_DN37558_c0_g1_i1:60-638(+)
MARFALLIALFGVAAAASIYDFPVTDIKGKSYSSLKELTHNARVVLVVNLASQCGFTRQYEGLEFLFKEHHMRGFSVVGFPCNQFGLQEPGSNADIAQFAQSKYGVTFPMLQKTDVNGENAHPIYKYMKSVLNHAVPAAAWNPGVAETDVQWNFSKFLVVDGVPVKRYSFDVTPESIEADVVKYLGTAHRDL